MGVDRVRKVNTMKCVMDMNVELRKRVIRWALLTDRGDLFTTQRGQFRMKEAALYLLERGLEQEERALK